jgi:hypothetical protein
MEYQSFGMDSSRLLGVDSNRIPKGFSASLWALNAFSPNEQIVNHVADRQAEILAQLEPIRVPEIAIVPA